MDKDRTVIYNTVSGMDDSSYWSNITNVDDFKMDSNFVSMLFSLISGMIWVIYITYYNSRVSAYIVTRLLTRFYATKGYLSIGRYI